MPTWSTTSTYEIAATAPAVWARAYAQADAWPHWNPELSEALLDRPLCLGATARVRFRSGLRLSFRVTEFEDGRLFTDEAQFPLARMGHRHVIEPAADGAILINTIYLTGPLARVWSVLVRRRAARALPQSQRAIEQLAAGAAI